MKKTTTDPQIPTLAYGPQSPALDPLLIDTVSVLLLRCSAAPLFLCVEEISFLMLGKGEKTSRSGAHFFAKCYWAINFFSNS